MKKLNGFTLAEILITLGIVGVVAALTLPSLTVNVQQQKAGPALAKAINTLESSISTLLVTTQARSLATACGENLPRCLANNATSASVLSARTTYHNWDGSNAFTTEGNSGITTKDGISFIQIGELQSVNNIGLNRNRFNGEYYEVAIDVDGPYRGENTYGSDTFKVLVDTRGEVIPHGGDLYNTYTRPFAVAGANNIADLRLNNPHWRRTCNENGVIGTGASCTAAIVENGFKATYALKNGTDDSVETLDSNIVLPGIGSSVVPGTGGGGDNPGIKTPNWGSEIGTIQKKDDATEKLPNIYDY